MPKNELHLYGSVGWSFWDEEYFTAAQVRAELDGRTGPLTVRINSGGGIATEGQAIYTMLVDYPDTVHVVIDGVAASAASLIAMAGETITMRLGAWMLIHDPAQPFTEGRGTEADHLKLADKLRIVSGAYADIYSHRARITREAARAVMRDETLYDGPAAVDAGFATAYDEETAAAAAARFDYRMYAHAPQELREACEGLGRVPGKMAAMAMFAGATRTTKETMMPKEMPSENVAEVIPSAVPAVDPAIEPAPAPPPAPEPVAAAQPEATIAERTRARRILDATAAAGLPVAVATDLIDRGVAIEAALDTITAKWKEQGDMDKPTMGREPARIQRDERETRRDGMEMALIAQLGRSKPADERARPFMAMSLVELAADAAGYNGPIRSAGDRIRAFEMAYHTASDFPAIFENALNKTLLARYLDAQPTYRRIAREVSFNDFRPHPMVRAGDFPTLVPVGDGGEITFGTFGESKETVLVKPYGVGIKFSRQMLVNDDMNAIGQVVADQGRAIARFEDATFYAMMLSGTSANGPTLATTTRQVFNATDSSLAGTAAAISVASLSIGRAALRKRKSLDGADLEIAASVLLVGPDKETEAQQIVAPIQAQQAGNVNPFSGTLSVVTTAKITGNAWYLFADPADAPCFVYGFLNGFEGPRMRTDEPFGQQGVAMSLEHDFGCGAIDFRGGFKNAGA